MKKHQKKMMTVFIIFISLLLGCKESEPIDPEAGTVKIDFCNKLFPPLDTVITTHTSFTKTNYPSRIKVFQSDTIKKGDIVMLGNSLTQQGGNWNIKLKRTNIKNRGIAGDNTDGIFARLGEVICMEPSMVFLMIGTNDLFTQYNSDKIARNIDSIGWVLATNLPESRIIIQTIMPLGADNVKKSKLLAVNDSLKSVVNSPYELLDTFQFMADQSGNLPQGYTTDGVHLTKEGYDKWVELLITKLQ